MSTLTVAEQVELSQIEHRIQDSLNQIELKVKSVWQEFSTIRQKRLYRDSHPSFEAYCRERWEKGRSYINKIIAAGETIANLEAHLGTTVPLPQTEREIRPIASLEPGEQVQAWEAATTIAPDQKPDSSHTTRAATAVKTKTPAHTIGQTVTILEESNEFYGKEAEVVRTHNNGIIVECKVEGTEKTFPFLCNEISSDAQPKPDRPSQPPQPKINNFAVLQTELDIERLRVELLERELKRLIDAIETDSTTLKSLAAEIKPLLE